MERNASEGKATSTGRWANKHMSKPILIVAAALLSTAAIGADLSPGARQAPRSDLPGVERGESARKLTPEELQRELFHFGDRYFELVGQATEDGMRRVDTAAVRSVLLATKVSYISSAISVVSGPNPLEALRDLIVMVTLQRTVWEGGADGSLPREPIELMSGALRELEREVVVLAARVMPAETIDSLLRLVAAWRAKHPDQHYVAFLRFHHLGKSQLADEVRDAISSGGFLAPIDAIAREAHEARLFAERGLFVAHRMPLIVGWQAELVYQRIAASEQVDRILGNLDRYHDTIDTASRRIEGLADQVGAQGRTLVEDAAGKLALERARTLRELESFISAERAAILRGLASGSREFGPLVSKLAEAAVAARATTEGIERLSKRSDGKVAVALVRLESVLERAGKVTGELATLVEGIDSLLGRNADLRGLAAVEEMLIRQQRNFFLLAAAFVVLCGVVIAVSLRVGRRRSGGPMGR